MIYGEGGVLDMISRRWVSIAWKEVGGCGVVEKQCKAIIFLLDQVACFLS